jgi:hypothetical protein
MAYMAVVAEVVGIVLLEVMPLLLLVLADFMVRAVVGLLILVLGVVAQHYQQVARALMASSF